MSDKSPTPNYYQRRIGGVLLDPYRIERAYGGLPAPLFSALKKILAAGQRGAKNAEQDIVEAIDALRRWQEMEREDVARASANEKEVFSTEYRKEFEAAFEQTILPIPSTEHDGVSSTAVFLTGQSAPAGMEDAPGNEVVELPPDYATNVESMARVVFSMDGVESEGKRPKKTLFVTTPGGEVELRWSPPDDREMTATEVEELRQMVGRFAPKHAAMPDEVERYKAPENKIAYLKAELSASEKARAVQQDALLKARDTYVRITSERDHLRERLEELGVDAGCRARVAELERERDEARANYGCAEEELRHLKAGYIKIKDELTAQRCAADNARAELAALRNHYRPRRQSEEPAPTGVCVLAWGLKSRAWLWRSGEDVQPHETWTHQPPAPEAEREGE